MPRSVRASPGGGPGPARLCSGSCGVARTRTEGSRGAVGKAAGGPAPLGSRGPGREGGACLSSRAAGGARAGRRHKRAAVAPPRPTRGAALRPAPAAAGGPRSPRPAASLLWPAASLWLSPWVPGLPFPSRPARSARSRARWGLGLRTEQTDPADRRTRGPTDPAPATGEARHHGNACQGLDHLALSPFGGGIRADPDLLYYDPQHLTTGPC